MDKSKEYIEMCRNGWIQELWKPKWGDFIWDFESELAYPISSVQINRNDCIWLPRLDQLQDMVDWKKYRTILEGQELKWSMHVEDPTRNHWDMTVFISSRDTLEQLWLAFVMHEKYGKKWDGTKWGPNPTAKPPPRAKTPDAP